MSTVIHPSPEARIIAAMGGEIFHGGYLKYDRQTPVGKLYSGLNDAALADQWDRVGWMLNLLYSLVGATTDNNCYAYQCGKSDLQEYIESQAESPQLAKRIKTKKYDPKVGDVVRHVRCGMTYCKRLGLECVVVGIGDDDDGCKVRFEDGSRRYLIADHLELVSRPEPSTDDLKGLKQ